MDHGENPIRVMALQMAVEALGTHRPIEEYLDAADQFVAYMMTDIERTGYSNEMQAN